MSNLYANANYVSYGTIQENDFADLCTTGACREYPYVKCGNSCDSQCARMKYPETAKYDFNSAGAGCLSGLSGNCSCLKHKVNQTR